MSKNNESKRKSGAAVRSTDGLGIGTIHDPKAMFLRNYVGEATCGKLKYEISTGMNGSPIVHSKKSGKWFSLSWQDILALAEKAGVDA
jgi:hypothetical protein